MAYYWKNSDKFYVNVAFTVSDNKRYVHQVEVRVGDFRWLLPRVYSEFEELHSQLLEYGVPQESFPPKRQGSRSHSIVGQTKNMLNNYLQTVIQMFNGQMPKPLQTFLEMKRYDCYFIVEDMYNRFLLAHEESAPKTSFAMTVMELHALGRVFKEQFPDIDQKDMLDYASILEMVNGLQSLYLEGSDTLYFRSPSKTNDLAIDFCFFKTLQKLELSLVAFHKIDSLGYLRKTLTTLIISNVVLPSLGDILLNDANDKKVTNNTQMWPSLTHLILNNCQINEIDISITLVPNLSELRLAENHIKVIPDMRFMTNMQIFDITDNEIENWDDMHLKLPRIRMLYAGNNQVNSLRGFRYMTRLEYLNLTGNIITDFEEITQYIAPLEKLRTVILDGNPVSAVDNFKEMFSQIRENETVLTVEQELGDLEELDLLIAKSENFGESSGIQRPSRVSTPSTSTADFSAGTSTHHKP